MATGLEKINYSTIKNAATQIKTQNNAINTALKNSQSTVEALSSSWTGSGAERTINAYKAFASKYSAQYQQWLDEYTDFLNTAAVRHGETDWDAAKNASAIEGI